MERLSNVRKKPVVLALIAVFLICAVLAAAGYSAWERQQQEPIFSFDPSDITLISIHVWHGENGNFITIIDRERIDCVVELLNNLRCRSAEELAQPSGRDTLVLHTADGGSTVLYFNTYSNGRPDAICVENTGGGATRYETAPGYFWELTEMPSSDVPKHEPEHPGPTAQPLQ